MAKFVSNNADTKDFLAMWRLLTFLDSSNDKDLKVADIKHARDDGLIDDDIAVELSIEFC